MQVFDLQLKLSSIQEELISILSTFAKPSDYQELLTAYALYRNNIYKAVTSQYSPVTMPILKGGATSTVDEQKQALADLQGVINSIEAMVIGSITESSSNIITYPNTVRESRGALIAKLYETFSIEYDNLYV